MRWVVVAHPDDELIFAGGAMLAHPHEPWTVVIVAEPDGTPRAAESLCARDLLRALGLDVDYRFLGHENRQFHSTGGIDPPTLIRQLLELGIRPGERVYTHGAPGEYGHNGHKAVHWSTIEALRGAAAVSVFSGGGEIVERIVDPDLLAGKARLFNQAYPSQVGVWTGLAQTMQEVIREERHFALSPFDAALGETTNPLGRVEARLPGDPDDGALTLEVNRQIALSGPALAGALVLGLGPGVDLAALRATVEGPIDVLDRSPEARGLIADRADIALIAEDLLQWDPGDRRYDLVICVGMLPRVRDFEVIFQRAALLLRPGGQLILTHEPLIEGHASYGRGYFVAEVPHYRRPAQSVLHHSRRNGLKLRVLKDFVAGRRMGEPVIHQLARLERR